MKNFITLSQSSVNSFSMFFFFIILLLPPIVKAQSETNSRGGDLFKELATLDSLFFGAIFNNCDPEKAEVLLAKDIEFYHDKWGLDDSPSANWIDSLKEECPGENKKRELIRGSLEIYPLKNYGAIQMGEHLFYEKQDDGSSKLYEKAKFTHLWRRGESGQWKLSRILSYDHQPVETK